jgi:hypothetical protein
MLLINDRAKKEISPHEFESILQNLYVITKHTKLHEHLTSPTTPDIELLQTEFEKFMSEQKTWQQITETLNLVSRTRPLQRAPQDREDPIFVGCDIVYRIEPRLVKKDVPTKKSNTTLYSGFEHSLKDIPKLIIGSEQMRHHLAIIYYG